MIDEKNAIEIKNVSKSFKIKSSPRTKQRAVLKKGDESQKKVILDDISLNIKKGEVIGVIGRNGSGKSTFLKLISRIMESDSGTIEVNGTVASILELGMGFHKDMTGRENIYIKGAMYGFSKSEIENRIDKIIEYSNLGDYIDNPLRTYSSGMTGRLAFAIMIHVNADIFLVDEILSVGDVPFSSKASLHFKSAAKSGKTIIFVSHGLGNIEEMCNRAIWIEEGKIREDGPAKRVCDHYRREMAESFDITSEMAESGVVDAQYRLGCMYLDGDKVGIDHVIACEWIKKAAEGKHLLAQVKYADLLFEGTGTEQDIATAILYYQMAADRGNDYARMKVSTLICNERDDARTQTHKIFEKLATKSNPLNEYKYADLLLKTAWNDDERARAFEWFSKSAYRGHLESKFQVAVMCRDGIGTQVDVKRSIKMFREAAEAGHPKAQAALAELFMTGLNVEVNEAEAFRWYLQSAESGNPKSQYRVAVMYRDGIGTVVDSEMSKMWFDIFSRSSFVKYQIMVADILKNQGESEDIYWDLLNKASESYNSDAMYKLGVAYRNQTPPDLNSAVKWLTLSAERNNTKAQMMLGDLYLKGTAVEKDLQKSFKYYRSASLNGNPLAAYHVSLMYKHGDGVEKNLDKYREFLQMAIDGGNRLAMREFKNMQ